MDFTQHDIDYLTLLAQRYPTIRSASTALINLTARLDLPKGTEHFVSDIHGEFEAFKHVLKNGSGSIKRKIDEIFVILSESEKQDLATLIYYPEQRLSMILANIDRHEAWFKMTLLRLIRLTKTMSAKYTRSDVISFLPDDLADIIDNLLYGREQFDTREDYYQSLLDTIISTNIARDFIIALSELIQSLAVSHLHVIGDIYDRGPGAEKVMDLLMRYHKVDIQWGNHDILWMGAASGSDACISNVIRISLRYANTETLENGYGISLLPLASFALDIYKDDPCEQFRPRGANDPEFTEQEIRLFAQMHKAITIIQLKLEGQLIQRRPHYQMENRRLLHRIDYTKGSIQLEGQEYELVDTHFPTIDPNDPYVLTDQELILIQKLRASFTNSRRLQRHVRFLYAKGSMYLISNGNLLYHGCIAMNEDGSFQSFMVGGQAFTAKSFMDRVDRLARQGYFGNEGSEEKQYGMDAMWYLWSGTQSPLFGKDKMATFERYFIADPSTHKETRNAYYSLRDDISTAQQILTEFGLDAETGHIINGHVPVKVKLGESPIKANGKLLVIDGGFAKAYQSVTGIAGYTLIFDSHGLILASHEPFESTQEAVENNVDVVSQQQVLETRPKQLQIRDTDEGREIQGQITALKALLKAFRAGIIKVK